VSAELSVGVLAPGSEQSITLPLIRFSRLANSFVYTVCYAMLDCGLTFLIERPPCFGFFIHGPQCVLNVGGLGI